MRLLHFVQRQALEKTGLLPHLGEMTLRCEITNSHEHDVFYNNLFMNSKRLLRIYIDHACKFKFLFKIKQ